MLRPSEVRGGRAGLSTFSAQGKPCIVPSFPGNAPDSAIRHRNSCLDRMSLPKSYARPCRVDAPLTVKSNAVIPTVANVWSRSLLVSIVSSRLRKPSLFVSACLICHIAGLDRSFLLRCALDPLSSSWNAVFVIILTSCSVSTRLVAGIDFFQVKVFNHTIGRWQLLLHARRQDLLEKLQVLGLYLSLVGEFDVELNVQVAEVVVSQRWHTLALDHLDSTRSDRLAWVDIDS